MSDWSSICRAAARSDTNATDGLRCRDITPEQPLYTCSYTALSSFWQIQQHVRNHGAVITRYALWLQQPVLERVLCIECCCMSLLLHRTAPHSTAQHTPQHRAERCPCRHHCPSVMLLCCCWRHACRIQVRTAHMPTVQLLMLSTCTVQLQRLLLSANPDPNPPPCCCQQQTPC